MYSQYLVLLLVVATASAAPSHAGSHAGSHAKSNGNSHSDSTTTTATTSSTAAAASTAAAVSATTSATTASTADSTNFCGAPNDYEVIANTPWIVFSMNYNYEDISGSCCTGYYDYTGTDDDQTIHWSSVWDIDELVNTDVVKGYSFIGLTENLETKLSDIASIPSTYQWTVSNTTAYKGKSIFFLGFLSQCIHTYIYGPDN